MIEPMRKRLAVSSAMPVTSSMIDAANMTWVVFNFALFRLTGREPKKVAGTETGPATKERDP